jgi:hypothetical protein
LETVADVRWAESMRKLRAHLGTLSSLATNRKESERGDIVAEYLGRQEVQELLGAE